ncbi:MAG: alpha,alpha-trehalase [Alphaproteobacteria bacterium]|nr:MAG: alpha,alpha-trehalase [Alphaproteobacteria bacterium]
MERTFQAIIDSTPQLLLRPDLGLNIADPKLPGSTPLIYVVAADRARAEKACGDASRVRVFDPVKDGKDLMRADAAHGLLYLPYPYLVPGGRFNEMYGWDTAFPVFAWAGSHLQLMREQVDNQLYQIDAYGKVLNANRSYYLSRSQPPMIAAMVLRIWQAAPDRQWLARAYDSLQSYHAYWTSGDRLADGGPLSRYWDEGDVPSVEVMMGEPGHYDHARAYFRLDRADPADTALFYDATADALTPLYYRADRSMRASGFDPTGHWGYGGLDCLFHAPLCLNSLLYRMEGDMAEIAGILGRPEDSATWRKEQSARRDSMRKLMFDPATGLYHDYDFRKKRRNTAPFATFFHALWAGLYDGDMATARKAADTMLSALETPYGIATSAQVSGSQWDYPYGWPPLQYFAFEGLRRCGFTDDAKRIAKKYMDLAARVYHDKGALFEKYNVEKGNAEVSVINGYNINVSENGTFLWTAAVLKLAGDVV